jgi:ATP-binding cassette subfamily A (ABC1) protein 3
MALIGDLPVILLDEPSSGVDPVSRHKLWQILANCKRDGQAIILSSHWSVTQCVVLFVLF